jgi:heat shock protein HslJ
VGAHTLVPGTQISLRFPETGKLDAQAGCNHLFGDVVFKGTTLQVTGMGGTDMGCDQARHAQDEWLSNFLAENPTWQLTGDELVLKGKTAEIKLTDRKVAEPDKKIYQTQWLLITMIEGETASSVPAEMKPAEVIFAEDGTVSGYTGCNRFSGKATHSPGKVKFESIASTKMACGDGIDAIERTVLAVLDGEVTAIITGDVLELKHPGGKGLQLKAQA